MIPPFDSEYPNFSDDSKNNINTFILNKNDFKEFCKKIIATEKLLKKDYHVSIHGLHISGVESLTIKQVEDEIIAIFNNISLCKEFGIKVSLHCFNSDTLPISINKTHFFKGHYNIALTLSIYSIDRILQYINSLYYFKQVINYTNDPSTNIDLTFEKNNFVVKKR